MAARSRPGPRFRSALAQITGYRAGRRPVPTPGLVTFKLSSNEMPFPPLPSVEQAVVAAATSINRYPDPASTAITGALSAARAVPRDEIVVGTGSVALCYHAAQAVAGPGDEIMFPWRSFEAYPLLCHVVGATPVPVPLTSAEEHDLDTMVARITPATRLIFVCTPNNPTGTAIAQTRLAAFLDEVPPDVLVVVDEAYIEFAGHPSAVTDADLVANRGNVLVLRTFSKAYGLAGLRVGYGVASPDIAAALRKTALPFPISNVAEAAAVASLAHAAELGARIEAVVSERERVWAALRHAGITVAPSEANFLWLRLGDQASDFGRVCDEQGLATRVFPGEGVRVTIGEPAANERFIGVAQTLRK